MKLINFETGPQAKISAAQAGRLPSITGCDAPENTNLAAPPLRLDEWPKAQRLQATIYEKWRATPYGQPLNHGLTPTQLRATIAFLNRMQAPASYSDLTDIIDRLYAVYDGSASGRSVAKAQIEEWVRLLKDAPYFSILQCYDAQIRSPEKFIPKVGEFLTKVKSHARSIERIRQELQRCQAETRPDT